MLRAKGTAIMHYLAVVPSLKSLEVIFLLCRLCKLDKLVQTIVDHLQTVEPQAQQACSIKV